MLKIAELACLIFIYLDFYSGKISYHLENDTVLLPCQHLTDKPIWYGPPNLTIYSIGVKLNTKLSKSDRLFIIHSDGSHQYNLGIRNFSIDDEGQYKCFKGGSQKDVQEIYFNLKKAKAPSNLTIETEDSNHIVYGYLNNLFNLTCTVIQGIPKGKLLWLVNDKTLAETDTSSLVHSFKPKQKDHLKQLACVTRSNFYDFELSRSVKLFVYMPPNVLIFPNQNPVILDEGDDLTLYCNYSSNHNITDLKWNRLMSIKSQLGTYQSSPDIFIENIKRENAGQYVCTVSNMAGNGSDNLTVKVNSLLKAPQSIMAVTFSDRIIVKWTSALDIGMQETFFVEYRKHIETSWSQVSVEDKYTAVINGLVADTVYLIRVYSRTASGKSYRTDNTIVKTEKQRSKGIVFSLELAVILGGVLLVPYLCFCGMKANAYDLNNLIKLESYDKPGNEHMGLYIVDNDDRIFKNRQKFCRNSDRRVAQSNRHAETSAQPAHYDEIDSMYYNPINETISSQNIIDNTQRTTLPVNADLENSSSENITPYINIQLESSKDHYSSGSSSEESYLVPCRNYIDLDIEKLSDNQDPNIHIDDPDIHQDESSVSSDNSNTNIKSIQRYESLKGSDINEHSYKHYNNSDV